MDSDITFNMELDHYKNKQGLQQVYLRITQNREHKRIKTNVFVKNGQFNIAGKNSEWVKKHPDAATYNQILEKKIKDAKAIWANKLIDSNFVNKDIIAAGIQRGQESKDFLMFFDKKYEQMPNHNQQKGYKTTRNHLVDFLNAIGLTIIDFRQITPSLLKDFENFLAKKELDDDSIYTQLKRIRAIYNKAIDEQVVEASTYPFRGYKMPKVSKNYKERLNENEVQLFADARTEQGTLKFHVQKSWIFSFYCAGIRVEDLLTMQIKNIVNGRLEYKMSKNGALKSIKITDKIQNLLNYYITDKSKPTDYIFPFLSKEVQNLDNNSKEFKSLISSKTALLNKYLKKIGSEARINKKITNHIARHSFANIARVKTKDITAIKNALGQSSVKITEMYLDSFDEKGLDAMMEEVVG